MSEVSPEIQVEDEEIARYPIPVKADAVRIMTLDSVLEDSGN